MVPVFICYARPNWSIFMITSMFNKEFDDDIVEVVDERIIIDEGGFMYKMFIVVFSHTNELFLETVLSNKMALLGKVFNPLMKLRIENFLKYTRVQSSWDISMARILIRVEDEMERIARIKEVDRPVFAEVEYIE
jgi:hypothetical protein